MSGRREPRTVRLMRRRAGLAAAANAFAWDADNRTDPGQKKYLKQWSSRRIARPSVLPFPSPRGPGLCSSFLPKKHQIYQFPTGPFFFFFPTPNIGPFFFPVTFLPCRRKGGVVWALSLSAVLIDAVGIHEGPTRRPGRGIRVASECVPPFHLRSIRPTGPPYYRADHAIE